MEIELFESITRYLASLNLDGDTLRAYTIDLHRLERTIGNVSVSTVTRDQLRDYLNNLTSKHGQRVSLATQNRHYATLHRFFEWCLTEKLLNETRWKICQEENPTRILERLLRAPS